MSQTETAPEKRQQQAKHSFLAADGSETKDMHEATGIKYVDIASGEEFTYQIPGATAGSPLTMLAVFGAKTKATNEASQVRQAIARGEDVDGSQVDEITAVFGKISDGIWREPGEGRVGAKIDRDALAAAIFEANPNACEGKGLQAIRERLDDDPAYLRKARKVDAVTELYNAKVGRAAPKPVEASEL